MVWSGWQGDVPPGNDRLTARFPIIPGITGMVREEFIAENTGLLGDTNIQELSEERFVGTLVYPVADPNGATLTVRQREADPRVTPAGLAWRLVDDRHVEITRPTAPGFDRGAIYEFIYRARDPIVMGIGFAAIRDIVSFLRHETKDNPLAPQGRPRIRRALGFGISQSGRVLRDLVHLGFNQDLAGRQVFDGILPVVAGSRRTCVNWQFAQAGRYSRQHEDHSYGDDQFPFSYPTLTDPISGRTGGILQRARDAGVCPKVLHLDTESDFWQARSSLIATDPSGADIAMPEEVRIYTASGVPHAPFRPLTKPVMQLPGNPLGYGAFMRALLVALFEWVEHGTAPPDSRFPSRAAGTLVPLAEARADIPPAAGGQLPERPERAAAARPFGRAAEREHGLPGVRASDGCRRQRPRRHPPPAACGASGHACRLVAARERLWRGRPVHHSRFDDPVRADRSRAAAGRRSAALPRSPLRIA